MPNWDCLPVSPKQELQEESGQDAGSGAAPAAGQGAGEGSGQEAGQDRGSELVLHEPQQSRPPVTGIRRFDMPGTGEKWWVTFGGPDVLMNFTLWPDRLHGLQSQG